MIDRHSAKWSAPSPGSTTKKSGWNVAMTEIPSASEPRQPPSGAAGSVAPLRMTEGGSMRDTCKHNVEGVCLACIREFWKGEDAKGRETE